MNFGYVPLHDSVLFPLDLLFSKNIFCLKFIFLEILSYTFHIKSN